jgi:hypothetical protein
VVTLSFAAALVHLKRADAMGVTADDSDAADDTPVVTPRHDSGHDKRDDKPRAPALTKPPSVADVIRDNPGLTNAELAALAGCKVRTIQRHKPKT